MYRMIIEINQRKSAYCWSLLRDMYFGCWIRFLLWMKENLLYDDDWVKPLLIALHKIS